MGSFFPMLIAGAALLGVGQILHLVGIATNYWVDGTFTAQQRLPNGAMSLPSKYDINFGIWKVCAYDTCKAVDGRMHHDTEFQACEAMAILGMLCGLVSTAVAVTMVVLMALKKSINRMMPILSIVASVSAAVFIMISIIIFAAAIIEDIPSDGDLDYSYSFGLCIASVLLFPLGGSLVLVAGIKGNQVGITG